MKWWRIVLGIFLAAWGLLRITNIQIEAANLLLGVLAIGSAVLLWMDR